jgi:hypothetical protein
MDVFLILEGLQNMDSGPSPKQRPAARMRRNRPFAGRRLSGKSPKPVFGPTNPAIVGLP